MASLTESFIDDLLARRTVTTTGGVTTITIPGFEELNEAQDSQVIARLQQEERAGTLIPGIDPDALEDALSCLTPPPPTKEELLVEAKSDEIEARQVPLTNVPEQYEKIIEYWRLFAHNDVELIAQFRNWERFRGYQKRIRNHYAKMNKPFSKHVERVREVRRRHGLGGDVRLRFSLEENDRKLENWIEFQAYHIQECTEPLMDKVSAHDKSRDNLQKAIDSADTVESKRLAEILEFNTRTWDFHKHKMEMERYFLQWSEQRRIEMEPRDLVPAEGDRGDIVLSNAAPKTSGPGRRKRQSKAPSVLGEPRISKRQRVIQSQKPKVLDNALASIPPATLSNLPVDNVSRITPKVSVSDRGKKQSKVHSVLGEPRISKRQQLMRLKKPRTLQTEPISILTATLSKLPTNNVSRVPDSRGAKPRRTTTQTSRRQLRASKVNGLSNIDAKSTIRSQGGQKRSRDAQSLPSVVEVTTRSGRISRPPIHWVPA